LERGFAAGMLILPIISVELKAFEVAINA